MLFISITTYKTKSSNLKQDLLIEYAKYLQDPCYFIEANFRVLDMTQGGYKPFKVFPFQKEAVYNYHNNRFVLLKKSRQAGMSTVTQAYAAYLIAMATKESPEIIYILANKLTSAKKFFRGVKEFLNQVPQWVWGDNIIPDKKKDNYIKGKGSTMKIEFANGSELHCVASSPDALRGAAISRLIFDECAFVQNGAEMYNSSVVATSTGGHCYLISTPNGKDELYYNCYAKSLMGENDYKISSAYWVNDPRYNYDLEWIEYDEDEKEISRHVEVNFDYEYLKKKFEDGQYSPTSTWFRDMCAALNNDTRAINQELLVRFEGSGGNVIKYPVINYYESRAKQVKFTRCCFDDNGWAFKDPIEGHRYIAGVDVATEDGKDYCTVSIFDIDEMELVFEYRGKCNANQLSEIVIKYCGIFKALTVVDTTGGYGDLVIDNLEKANFKHLYYEEFIEDVKIKDIGRETQWKKKKKKAGFKIQKVRHSAISHYVNLIHSKTLKMPSIRQVTEWGTFIWLNGRQDHQSGFNDDLIMGSVMALWVANTVYNKIEKVNKVNEIIKKHFIGFGITAQDLEEAVGEVKPRKPVYTNRLDPTHEWDWVVR